MARNSRSASASVTGVLVAALLLLACGPRGPARPGESAAAPPPEAGRIDGTHGMPPAAAPVSPTAAAYATAKGLTLDELHGRAVAEGGTVAFYGTLAQINAQKILPAFEQRFPGMKVEHVDATSDTLQARIMAEARAGKVLGDVFSTSVEYMHRLDQQGLLLRDLPPEALAYPEELRGSTWIATDLQYMTYSWNTNLVRPDEAPRQLEDLADPRWRNRIIAEPRDIELLVALTRKLGSEERAVEVLRRIAANDVEFHRGHSELTEMLSSGQAAVCATCYAHQYPPRIRRGAPLDFMRTEAIGSILATGVFKDAPRPYAAMLWHRWTASEEGQRAYVEGGRNGAHPNLPANDSGRPDRVIALSAEDLANTQRIERVWKETFQLR
jgi:iron(III) transport system substrate-binding protein